MRARLALAAVLVAALAAPAARASPASQHSSAFAGLGTWLDIFAGRSAWSEPGREVGAVRRDGVRTLYIETGNYKQSVDLMRQRALGRFVDDAHAAGLRIVAWYLPSFANLARDERRALAAIRFRSPTGQSFDGFALDIEATVVRGLPLRDRRLIQLSARLRSAVGPGYALGAITPSPVGMSPYYWPGIPYRTLTRYYDVFLPMAYSTMRGIRGSKATLAYLSATVEAIRTSAGDPSAPIHLIGGLGRQMGRGETSGFMRAINAYRPLGYSLYALPATQRGAWSALRSAR
ncbi:MAG TPA: hypothetical protein VKE27_09470 [Candidatus Dormibacteraeota bacterium]|nr:hypothetical protein [Candidatus Dormibacteraeota bacterium]